MLNKSVVKLTLLIIVGYIIINFAAVFSAGYYNHKTQQLWKEHASEIQRISAREVAKVVLPKLDMEHLRCLATNIYHEAGGEPFMGQVAVARVVMNRIKHGFASNPCKVTYQHTTIQDADNPESVRKVCQFSWVCEGKTTPSRNQIYIQAEKIAKQVLLEDKWRDEIPSDLLFFHNTQVNPNWNYRQSMIIGNHVFYSKHKKQ